MTNGGPHDYDRRVTTGALGAFGADLIRHSFDPGIRATRRALSGDAAAEADRSLHERLQDLTPDEREAAEAVARAAVVEALHGLLYRASDGSGELQVLFQGTDVASTSDGLYGDLFIWMRDLSEFSQDWEQQGPRLQ